MLFLVRLQDPEMEADCVVVHRVCKEYGVTPCSYYFPYEHNPHKRFAIDREVLDKYDQWHARIMKELEAENKRKSFRVSNPGGRRGR